MMPSTRDDHVHEKYISTEDTARTQLEVASRKLLELLVTHHGPEGRPDIPKGLGERRWGARTRGREPSPPAPT